MPIKRNKRPTTARFTAEECELLLDAIEMKINHDVAVWAADGIDEDDELVRMHYRIQNRLRDRIFRERVKLNQQSD